jgi:tetratricopeptide (TPR) repeat protein
LAHYNLGNALRKKGDRDGAIAEYRTAIRLQPDLAAAHYNLSNALETKGDRQGALEESRTAYMLDPKNSTYKRKHERLLQRGTK